jgi:ABC-type Zn2+ transport system substrate-binding protein/surface adhesin
LATCLIGATAITGCGVAGSAHQQAGGVVASTDVWGSVAHTVAGRHINVQSILSGATIDPHAYQASASDAATIMDAALVIYNGGGYDPWITAVLTGHPNIKSVDAYSFVGHADNGNPPNEHVFYDLGVAKTVANTIADRLAAIDADDAAGRGVPVRALGIVFAALVGIVAAQAVQIVGALLVMSLLITPVAAAARVVASPAAPIVASVIFAEVAAVGGIVLSLAPGVPVSVFVATISFLIYLFCWLLGRRQEAST